MPSDGEGEFEPPLTWRLELKNVPLSGLRGQWRATDEERAALAKFLDILTVADFSIDYVLTLLSGGRARLRGRVNAKVEQACVVSQDPIAAVIAEDFNLEFWPPEDIGKAEDVSADDAQHPDDADPPEAMVDGGVALGALATELLAISLDPYPRRPGAEFIPTDDGSLAADNPFAVLSRLKKAPN